MHNALCTYTIYYEAIRILKILIFNLEVKPVKDREIKPITQSSIRVKISNLTKPTVFKQKV